MATAVPADTRTGSNRTAFPSPYADPNLTVRNGASISSAVDPIAHRDLGPTRFYDDTTADGVDLVDNSPDNPPSDFPREPFGWASGRDVYKNDGMPGEPFYGNQG